MTNKYGIKDTILSFKLATAEEIGVALGRRLKTQRLSKNLKQEDLAGRAGISVGTVKNLESKGQSSLESLIRIVMALDLTAEIENLFQLKAISIAEMEKAEQLRLKSIRKRAR